MKLLTLSHPSTATLLPLFLIVQGILLQLDRLLRILFSLSDVITMNILDVSNCDLIPKSELHILFACKIKYLINILIRLRTDLKI